jgi:hypothetical protein
LQFSNANLVPRRNPSGRDAKVRPQGDRLAQAAPALCQNDGRVIRRRDLLLMVGLLALPASVSAGDVVPQALPGAGTVAILFDPWEVQDIGRQAAETAAQEFADEFSARFDVRTITIEGRIADTRSAAQILKAHGALLGVGFFPSCASLPTNALGAESGAGGGLDCSLLTRVIDTYGFIWFGSRDQAHLQRAHAASSDNFADLTRQAVSTIDQQITSSITGPSAKANFFRYALPMAYNEYRTFIRLEATPTGVTVCWLAPFSDAAAAGLQIGDIVVSINGVPLGRDASAQVVAERSARIHSSAEDFETVDDDGAHQHVQFAAKDLSWYLERRAAMGPMDPVGSRCSDAR